MAILLTPEETAEELRLAPKTVKDWLRDGKLPGVKLGGKVWRIRREDLDAFIVGSATKRASDE
ncbi:MAG: helix-turn-helix domain-containing protein [Candidatus Entotheonellia bacterium]